jgi:hypothetical protein
MMELTSKRLVQISWLVTLAFVSSSIVVSFSAATANSSQGFIASSFSCIWAALTSLLYAIIGTRVTLNGAPPIYVGQMIGMGIGLALMYFTLMIMFFIVVSAIPKSNQDVRSANEAMGSFSLFNFLIFGGWSYISFLHRGSLFTFEVKSSSNFELAPLEAN